MFSEVGERLSVARLLLIEDDELLGKAVEQLLTEEGYQVFRAVDGETGLEFASQELFDALILDLMIPGIDGFAVLKELRKDKNLLPVMILTAKDSVNDRVRGLDLGADDYLVKPFATTELLARVRALLRRAGADFQDPNVLSAGVLQFNKITRECIIAAETQILPPKEAELLEMFLLHPKQVLTREQLMNRLWGYEADVLENTLETYISKLRKRLDCEECPNILTVRGLGYRLQMNA